MSDFLSKEFWDEKYLNQSTGWDLGAVSPPIREYFDQIEDREVTILIPGCGSGYEAEYLFRSGFNNVTVLDFSAEALNAFKQRVPDFPEDQIIHGDFFKHEGKYDFIIEQTLFCAIDPKLRQAYAAKAHELLNPGGKLVGVLFDREFDSGPPFGGSKEEYLTYFSKYFGKIYMEACYNSIEPRWGSELFVVLER